MDSRGLAKRHAPALEELTSRKNSRDIPGLLDRLEIAHDPAMPPHVKVARKPTRANPLDVVLATNMISVGIDIDRQLNKHGGAIALGHPFGMTGARIMTTLLNGLEDRDARYGLETMCVGGGQGMAMIVERLK